MITCKRILLGNSEDTKDLKSSSEIKDFFSVVLEGFCSELERIADKMYKYPKKQKGIDSKESINDVFALIERSYVGILNNAIIRNFPNDATLQEFAVYGDKDAAAGRADLLVEHVIPNNKTLTFIFEAKAGIADGKEYTKNQNLEYYAKIYEQAWYYYNQEKKFYSNDDVIIVTITFDWIRNEKFLDVKNYTDDVTDFYYIYSTNEAGLAVYGTYRKLT